MWTLLTLPREEGRVSARVSNADAAAGVCGRPYPRDGLVYVQRWQTHILQDFRNPVSKFRSGVAAFPDKILSARLVLPRSFPENNLKNFLFVLLLVCYFGFFLVQNCFFATCRFWERFVFPGGCSDVACFGFWFCWCCPKVACRFFFPPGGPNVACRCSFCRGLGVGRVLLPFDRSGNSHRRMVDTHFSTNLSRKFDCAIWFFKIYHPGKNNYRCKSVKFSTPFL